MNGSKAVKDNSKHMLVQSAERHEKSSQDRNYYFFDLPKNSIVQEILFHRYARNINVEFSILVNSDLPTEQPNDVLRYVKKYRIRTNTSETINLPVKNGGVLQCLSGNVIGKVTIWYYVQS